MAHANSVEIVEAFWDAGIPVCSAPRRHRSGTAGILSPTGSPHVLRGKTSGYLLTVEAN
jgi:hypothetical protein